VAAALIAVVPAAPAFAAPQRGQVDGTASLGQFGSPTAHVNAAQNKSGLKGSFTIEYPDGTYAAGTPTCLFVSDNAAYLTAKITRATGTRVQANNWTVGNYLVIGARDRGEAGPDQLNFAPGFAADPGWGANQAANPAYDVVDGDYHVFDAS